MYVSGYVTDLSHENRLTQKHGTSAQMGGMFCLDCDVNRWNVLSGQKRPPGDQKCRILGTCTIYIIYIYTYIYIYIYIYIGIFIYRIYIYITLQGYSEAKMLNAIVNSAYTWMSNGLNINKFKLVLYMSSEKMVSLFKELKRKLNRRKY